MHTSPALLAAVAVRTAIVLLALIGGLRLLGKRELGQFNIYDLALVMAVSNAIQNAMTAQRGELLVGIVAAGTLLLLGRGLTLVFVRAPALEQRVIGTPTVLVNDGRLVRENLRRECLTEEELLAALRVHGLLAPSEARLVVLEVDGTLSVVPRPPRGPHPHKPDRRKPKHRRP